MNVQDLITIDNDILGGQPVLKEPVFLLKVCLIT